MRPISVGKNLTANVKTTIYTVPPRHYATWDLLFVTNHSGTNKTVSVWWYDKTQNIEVTIIDAYPLTSHEYLKFDGNAFVVLEEGDEVRIITEAGSVMSSVNTFEIYPSTTSPLI
jgi:hypothetical protein